MRNQKANFKDFLSLFLRIVTGKRMMCLRQLSKRNQWKTGRNRYNMKMKKINEEELHVFLYFLNNYVWANVLMKHDALPFLKQQSKGRKHSFKGVQDVSQKTLKFSMSQKFSN